MSRTARKKCESGIYHVILRGVNKQIIFEEKEDYFYFENILKKCRQTAGFKLFSVCLMDNHVHMLMQEGTENLSMTMKKIENAYVYWYNRKYDRAGHLFQNRFISEPVLSDRQFMVTARYIFNNPVKAGIVNKAAEYPWCNFPLQNKIAIKKRDGIKMFETDIQEIVNIFEDYSQFENFMSFNHEDNVIEYDNIVAKHLSMDDEECIGMLRKISGCGSLSDFSQINMDKKQECVIKLKRQGASVRQLSRITGLSKSMIGRICVGTQGPDPTVP